MAIFGAITGLVSLALAFVSAVASCRSAAAAKTSAVQASDVERRALIRELVVAAGAALGSFNRVETLAAELINKYQTLFALAGRSGSDRDGYIKHVESRKACLFDIRADAERIAREPRSLSAASAEDMAISLAKFDGHRAAIDSVCLEFERLILSAEEQIRPLRDTTFAR